MKTIEKLDIYIDGASEGNPGDSGIGIVIKNKDIVLAEFGEYIGVATNNVAEYKALIAGMQKAIDFKPSYIKIYSDSELLVKQLTGEYKVKSTQLKPLYEKIKKLSDNFNNIDIKKIPREENKQADKLATKAIKHSRGIFPKISS